MYSAFEGLVLEEASPYLAKDFLVNRFIPKRLDRSHVFAIPVSRELKGHIAWEAPSIMPKICYHSQSRYSRSVPIWELQAPDNWFSLATLLRVIELEVDTECVLTVRKIHKLGLNSASILREHFSRYGEVERVMLLPSRPKSAPGGVAVGTIKVRPASMAFVVMRSRQPAIIARLQEVHYVDGYPIQVQKFRQEKECAEVDANLCLDNYSWLESISTDCTPPVGNTRKNSYAPQIIN
jgi:hypothetical protein